MMRERLIREVSDNVFERQFENNTNIKNSEPTLSLFKEITPDKYRKQSIKDNIANPETFNNNSNNTKLRHTKTCVNQLQNINNSTTVKPVVGPLTMLKCSHLAKKNDIIQYLISNSHYSSSLSDFKQQQYQKAYNLKKDLKGLDQSGIRLSSPFCYDRCIDTMPCHSSLNGMVKRSSRCANGTNQLISRENLGYMSGNHKYVCDHFLKLKPVLYSKLCCCNRDCCGTLATCTTSFADIFKESDVSRSISTNTKNDVRYSYKDSNKSIIKKSSSDIIYSSKLLSQSSGRKSTDDIKSLLKSYISNGHKSSDDVKHYSKSSSRSNRKTSSDRLTHLYEKLSGLLAEESSNENLRSSKKLSRSISRESTPYNSNVTRSFKQQSRLSRTKSTKDYHSSTSSEENFKNKSLDDIRSNVLETERNMALDYSDEHSRKYLNSSGRHTTEHTRKSSMHPFTHQSSFHTPKESNSVSRRYTTEHTHKSSMYPSHTHQSSFHSPKESMSLSHHYTTEHTPISSRYPSPTHQSSYVRPRESKSYGTSRYGNEYIDRMYIQGESDEGIFERPKSRMGSYKPRPTYPNAKSINQRIGYDPVNNPVSYDDIPMTACQPRPAQKRIRQFANCPHGRQGTSQRIQSGKINIMITDTESNGSLECCPQPVANRRRSSMRSRTRPSLASGRSPPMYGPRNSGDSIYGEGKFEQPVASPYLEGTPSRRTTFFDDRSGFSEFPRKSVVDSSRSVHSTHSYGVDASRRSRAASQSKSSDHQSRSLQPYHSREGTSDQSKSRRSSIGNSRANDSSRRMSNSATLSFQAEGASRIKDLSQIPSDRAANATAHGDSGIDIASRYINHSASENPDASKTDHSASPPGDYKSRKRLSWRSATKKVNKGDKLLSEPKSHRPSRSKISNSSKGNLPESPNNSA